MINEYITYNKNDILTFMYNICNEYKLQLILINNETECKNKNISFNYGWHETPNTIGLSYFTPDLPLEYLLITFFHEFAHAKLSDAINNDLSTLLYELNITIAGINFAKTKYNLEFSAESINWIINQNFAYKYDSNKLTYLTERSNNKYTLCISKNK